MKILVLDVTEQGKFLMGTAVVDLEDDYILVEQFGGSISAPMRIGNKNFYERAKAILRELDRG